MTPPSSAPRSLSRRRVIATSVGAVGALALSAPTTWASEKRSTVRPHCSTSPSLVVRWNEATMDAILAKYKAAGAVFGPATVNARALAIVHNCIYDAWACYDSVAVGTQFGGSMRRPRRERTPAHMNEAISYAAHTALVDLFPLQAPAADSFMTSLGYDPTRTSAPKNSPADIGLRCAKAVLDFRHQDGANQLGNPAYADTTGYVPVNPAQAIATFDPALVKEPEHWTPLIVNGATQKYLTPQFAVMKPFALERPDQFSVPAPPSYPSLQASAAIAETVAYSANLTDEQKAIAEFWLDNDTTPPGAQQLWARFVSARDGYDIGDDAKLFFGLNMAETDAAIGSWAVKIKYNYARPSTLVPYDLRGQQIQAWGGPGQGTVTMDGSKYRAYVAVPGFPATVSGHSTFSGAAAEFLRRFTGSDEFGDSYTFKAGTSTVEPGITPAKDVTLTWPTFTAAAEQAGISRIYGGMHWSFDNEPGIVMGHQIGAVVYDKAMSYFNGDA
ncbi:vanadium-dependent haloperoxidase [Kitasatospora sp. McL0602]|uniref:vanadium-dependent haloperoxidase n=1 Tax=Kitasatospora sp. McL0602 TaxID=3439530 RepID=UPI003F892FAF